MLALSLLAEGPNTELLWLLYAGMAFFFLAIIVGWLTSPREQKQVKAQLKAPKSKARRKAPGK